MPVQLSIDEGVATIRLDRPAKRNALDQAMLESLIDVVARVRRAPVRVVVLRGEGGTFCAGADIGDWVAPGATRAGDLSALGREAFTALARLPVPSVAAIEGTAVGGGLELALACDLRVASAGARLGLPELGLGNLPAWGGLARLIAVAGLGVTRRVLLTGELLDGAEAARLGIVTLAGPDLDELVEVTTERLAGRDPAALELAKTVLAEFERDLPLEPALAALTAGWESSHRLKQEFLDRRSQRRHAKEST